MRRPLLFESGGYRASHTSDKSTGCCVLPVLPTSHPPTFQVQAGCCPAIGCHSLLERSPNRRITGSNAVRPWNPSDSLRVVKSYHEPVAQPEMSRCYVLRN